MNGQKLATVTMCTLTVCAVILTSLTVRREFIPPSTRPERVVPDWNEYVEGGSRIGPTASAVTVVVFSDYECPFCRNLERELYALRMKYPRRLAVVWRQFPLDGHPHSEAAAKAALCAARQGRFKAYHEALFYGDEPVGLTSWQELASRAGVPDTGLFLACLDGDAVAAILGNDVRAAKQLGVVSTPTILVNSMLFTGIPPDLDRIVRREVGRMHDAGTEGSE